MITFRKLNMINFTVCSILFLLLLAFPEPIFFLFDVNGNEAAFFICRRTSMLFGGYAIISFFTKDLQHSKIRQTLSLGFAFSMAGFALMGTIEFIRGFAGGGIFFAVASELFLTVSYCYIWLCKRKTGVSDHLERTSYSGMM